VNAAAVHIERVAEADEVLVASLARLLPQLSSATPPTLEELRRILSSPSTHLFVARLDDEIVGTLTLEMVHLLTGARAVIEDVVVDAAARGRGVGTALVHAGLELAGVLGARAVDLTSRPSRAAANELYRRLGFDQRETNVYRLTLEK
jgi:ribosomal protein S18 acetylase RimI-like enzyme